MIARILSFFPLLLASVDGCFYVPLYPRRELGGRRHGGSGRSSDGRDSRPQSNQLDVSRPNDDQERPPRGYVRRPWWRLVAAMITTFTTTLTTTPTTAQVPQPPVERVDIGRSGEKQRDAARLARQRTSQGPGEVREIFALLLDPSGVVRDAVFEQIVEKWSAEDRRKLASGLTVLPGPPPSSKTAKPQGNGHDDRHGNLQEILAEIYLHRPDEKQRDNLLHVASRSSSSDAREMALGALARLPEGVLDEDSIDGIEKMASRTSRGNDWVVRGEALRTLARVSGEGALALLEKTLKEKKIPALRIAALQGLAEVDRARGCEAAVEAAVRPWNDRQGIWGERIRRAALAILAQQGSEFPRSERARYIDELIEAAPTMEGATGRRLWETLGRLTEHPEVPASASSWDSWWKARKSQWIAEQEATDPQQPASDDGPEESGTRVVRYHGVELDSRRIVFLSDVSGGMSRTIDGQFDGTGPRRIEVARIELLRVLDELPREALVQVVHFASHSMPALSRVQPLARSRKSLQKEISSQQVPSGRGEARGNLYGPLRRAVLEPGTDTVILLTEGAPTEGKIHDSKRLLWHIRRWNRWGQAPIHVLSVGKLRGDNRAFLETLATESGGGFHDVDGTFGKMRSSSRRW